MKNEKELQELRGELSKIVGYIADYGDQQEFNNDSIVFANDVCDSISWVLEEIPTEHFKTSDYLNIDFLNKILKKIEKRTGKLFEDYEV